ncbi:hypothetical protein [Ramlibacter sp.]|uniref:hypothetical protein n=1 Tax=Ramlibacter sp. TaxID=1917967 RepID=UPI003D0C72F2
MENLPLQRDATPGLPVAVQVLLALLVVLALVLALVLQRRRGGGFSLRGFGGLAHPHAAGSAPCALHALRLTPSASLHLVRWGDEELLIACGASHVELLARRPVAAAAAPSEASE